MLHPWSRAANGRSGFRWSVKTGADCLLRDGKIIGRVVPANRAHYVVELHGTQVSIVKDRWTARALAERMAIAQARQPQRA